MYDKTLIDSPLGKNSVYQFCYDPTLLFAVPRKDQRLKIEIDQDLPFAGYDLWNAYEISWLNSKGKPEVAIGEFYVPCNSTYITESKSLKLYLNSFYQTRFDSVKEIEAIIKKDLSDCVKAEVRVNIIQSSQFSTLDFGFMPGKCLDDQDIEIETYSLNPELLKCSSEIVEENLYSNLLKSNCLGTRQPDWASLYIHYKGPKIDHASLLKYIISFRTHNEFGEHCIERVFQDLRKHCLCQQLTVYGRYTRRGGIDLNPYRSNFEEGLKNKRDYRQ